MFRNQKRGVSLREAPAAVIVLMVIAIVLGLAGTILANIQGTQTADTAAYNATADGLAGVTTFSGFQTTIAIILVAAVILGLIGTALLVSRLGR